MTYLFPMLATILLSLVFVGALLFYVLRITSLLKAIGGDPTSFLAKLRLGLRAIEKETGHLPQLVEAANGELETISGGLESVDGHLKGTLEAAAEQERRA